MTIAQSPISLPALIEQRADSNGADPYVILPDGGSRTYGEYHADVLAWAARLTVAGVVAGDTVLVMTDDALNGSQIWMALGWLRAIEVPINRDYRGAYLSHVVADSRAKLLIADEGYIGRVAEAWEQGPLERVVIMGGGSAGGELGELPWQVLTLDELDADATITTYTAPQLWDSAGIIYTSGTTGRSKGVLTTWAQRYETTTNTWPLDLLISTDTYYNMFPQFHIAGKGPFLQQALLGSSLVLKGKFSTSDFWADIDRFDVKVTQLVGAMASFLWNQPEAETDATHALEKVLITPIPPYVEEFKQRFGVQVRSVFNMTEVSTPIAGDGFQVPPPGSCGRARAGADVRIVDDNDLDVPVGDVGELVVRNENPWTLMQGYWGQPEATLAAWKNLWFHTGDAFKVDELGNYSFVDRKKDALRRRGENISSFEVEEAVLATGLVEECAVIGVPSEHLEDEVMAFVVIAAGTEFDPETLHRRVSDLLPRFMVPSYIEVIDELPRTPTARIRKHLLRERGVGPDAWVDTTNRRARATKDEQ